MQSVTNNMYTGNTYKRKGNILTADRLYDSKAKRKNTINLDQERHEHVTSFRFKKLYHFSMMYKDAAVGQRLFRQLSTQ